jgi:hypothetical protein
MVNIDPIPMLGDPNDKSLKEYIVTVKSHNDLNSLYGDMENAGGNQFTPSRAVEVKDRRPGSRNTHYVMSYDEAAKLKDDPRVLAVELNPADLGFEFGPFGFEQTSAHFDKRVASDSNDINWGLLRCLRKTDISNWGIDGTVEQSRSIISDATGKNVDVVIMDDGCPYPTVLEYQQNADGTGYNRMVEYNWFRHNPAVNGSTAGQYSYSANRLQQHGGHTTGTVAGNTQGWARDANIYNITFYDSILYVKEFHKNKPVNPLTGVKNPTIMNNSWGYRGGSLNSANISKLSIRGVDYYPLGGTQGSYVWDPTILEKVAYLNKGGAFPARSASVDADMIDAMAAGVVVVASAGNSYFYQDREGGIDYNNYMVYSGTSYWIHRGSSPGAADGGTEGTKVICVGAVGQHNESVMGSVYSATGIEVGDYKAEFSNYGPRVDVFAPGSGIQSVWSVGTTLYDGVAAPDPRCATLGNTDLTNNNFKKCPGTSMSGPQVTGVLACLAEKYPRMTQELARKLIANFSTETILSTSGGSQDYKDAGFSFNPESCKKMLFLKGTRMPSAEYGGFYGTPYPTVISSVRATSGSVYPRTKTTNSFNARAQFSVSSDVSSVAYTQTTTVTMNASNVPNGTLLPYIITAKPVTSSALVDTGVTAVCNTTTAISGVNLSSRPNTSTRVVTTSTTTGTSSSITNALAGSAGLTESTFPGSGTNDDGFWSLPLPFAFTFAGTPVNLLGIGTNGYITINSGSTAYNNLGEGNPALNKILISSGDLSCQRIYYGTTGVFPNRQMRVRWEGHINYTGGVVGNPTIVWEFVIFENNPTQFEIHMGVNGMWQTAGGSSNYAFGAEDLSVPLVGTVAVNNGTATLPIRILSTDRYRMNVRLGVHPTPSIDIQVN